MRRGPGVGSISGWGSQPTRPAALVLRPGDDVAVATRLIPAGYGAPIAGDPELREIRAAEAITPGHKVALHDILRGEPIRKYGQVIGYATSAIAAGAHVHVHNCGLGELRLDHSIASESPPTPVEPPRTFRGYAREDGRAGTRNFIAVVSTVNCSATVARAIARRFGPQELRAFPGVDGVFAVAHRTGCGQQYDGEDHRQLARTLGGFVRHPNVAAAVIVGLGCEVAQIPHLVETERLVRVEAPGGERPDPCRERGPQGRPAPRLLTIQETGGTTRTVEAGVRAVMEALPRASEARRVEMPASKIVLALQCGGSDGYSGVTANPALGVAADLVVAQGGTAALAETPEIFGAEHLLARRAASREVGEALLERLRWWAWYTGIFGAEMNNNPSPGNKEGGLTTIWEKSLGAVAKGGSTVLRAVYRYAEPIVSPGLVFMDTPGYDPVSMTGLMAGGANVGAFTTGRGSAYGSKPAPSIKIATNTALFERMSEDMDVDAGVILAGASVAEVGRAIFERILAVASGETTKSEGLGMGDEEFAPWSIGPTL